MTAGTDSLSGGVLRPVGQYDVGSDEHRVEVAQWVLQTFDSSTGVYKKAAKLIEHYLAGKPLPKAE